eukprot:3756611-Rhodomonas_salina.2
MQEGRGKRVGERESVIDDERPPHKSAWLRNGGCVCRSPIRFGRSMLERCDRVRSAFFHGCVGLP